MNLLPIGFYKVKGRSMEPNYKPGDYLLINQWARNPGKGEVVVLKDPGNSQLLLKRVVQIRGKRYYVKGDNPAQSTDSRHFGWVKRSNILGKVLWRIAGG